MGIQLEKGGKGVGGGNVLNRCELSESTKASFKLDLGGMSTALDQKRSGEWGSFGVLAFDRQYGTKNACSLRGG